MIVVLDYGMGNLRSVERAISFLGYSCRIQPDLRGAEKLVIPGVGAFGAAMERIQPLANEIRSFAKGGGPLLGICLGQQLLMERSEEIGEHTGLGLIAGNVRYLPSLPGIKIPHVGWNSLMFPKELELTKGVSEWDQVYFVHSLYTECADAGDVAAHSEHGITFPAAVCRGSVCATQFHPEKSGEVGLRILSNWLKC